MDPSDPSKRLPMQVSVYGAVVLLAFVWRFLSILWDLGGCFFQFWVAVVAVFFFVTLFPQLTRTRQMIAQLLLLPIGALLQFGSIYFVPQSLFPFLLVALAVVAGLFWWSSARGPGAVFISLLLVPLGIYCLYGLKHMVLLSRVRSLAR